MAKVDLKKVQELRQRTGIGMLDCRKALEEAGGDIDKAIELLRKKGAAVAQKRSDNETAEGIVHAYIHPGSKVGVLLEINCETDFVARTEDVKQFAADVSMQIAALKPLCVDPSQLDKETIEKERAIYREQLQSAGKPEHVIDKIIEGKIEKFYSEVCLLNQSFIKDDKLTIADLLKELIAKMGEKMVIKRFTRYEIGSKSQAC